MANVESIAKAKAYGFGLEQFFGVKPDYEYYTDHVRIYYQPDRLKQVQAKINAMAAEGPSDVRIDWVPMVTPQVMKTALPYALGLLGIGFLLGKAT